MLIYREKKNRFLWLSDSDNLIQYVYFDFTKQEYILSKFYLSKYHWQFH